MPERHALSDWEEAGQIPRRTLRHEGQRFGADSVFLEKRAYLRGDSTAPLFYPDYFAPENGPAVHVLRESEAKAWQFDIIHMQGDVEAMLGDAVEATVRAVLN